MNGCLIVASVELLVEAALVGVVRVVEVVESAFVLLFFGGRFLFSFFPFLPFRLVLLDGFRFLLVDRGCVDVPCLFHIPVLFQVDIAGVVEGFFRLQSEGIVARIVFSVAVAVNEQTCIIFCRKQVEEHCAAVFHRHGQYRLVGAGKQFYTGQRILWQTGDVERQVAVFFNGADREFLFERCRKESVNVGNTDSVDAQFVAGSRFPFLAEAECTPVDGRVAEGHLRSRAYPL